MRLLLMHVVQRQSVKNHRRETNIDIGIFVKKRSLRFALYTYAVHTRNKLFSNLLFFIRRADSTRHAVRWLEAFIHKLELSKVGFTKTTNKFCR